MAQTLKRDRLQCSRPGFDPWVGKIPWRRERLLSPVLWPREIQELYSPWGCKESDTTERLSLTHSLTQHLGESIPFDQFLCHLACPLTSPFLFREPSLPAILFKIFFSFGCTASMWDLCSPTNPHPLHWIADFSNGSPGNPSSHPSVAQTGAL